MLKLLIVVIKKCHNFPQLVKISPFGTVTKFVWRLVFISMAVTLILLYAVKS